MLAKNEKRLLEHQLGYLRQISAYDISHALLMLAGVLAAIIPLVRGFDRGDIDIVKWMTVVIISLYWLLQFRILRSAVLMAGYKEQNASSPFAKARMVLWHHQTYIVMMSLMLLGLSIAIMGFLYYGLGSDGRGSFMYVGERGILQYVGIVSIGARWYWPLLPHAAFVGLGGALLLALTFAHSLLTASIGLWARKFGRALLVQITIMVIIAGCFLGLYHVSASTPDKCVRSWMSPYRCPDILFRNRIVDSWQGVTLSFLDGGASVVTGIYCPKGSNIIKYQDEQGFTDYQYLPTLFGTKFDWRIDGYQTRHLVMIVVAIVSQLGLSGLFLRIVR